MFNNEILKINYSFDKSKQLFGSSIGSLIIRDIATGEMQTIDDQISEHKSWVRSIKKDRYRKYWVATSNQLSVLDSKFRVLKKFKVKQHVSFYGHLETLFFSSDKRFIFWWTGKNKVDMFNLITMRYVATLEDFIEGIYKTFF